MKFFDNDQMTFGITTNGSALRSKHAEFFSTLKSQVIVTISHDAKMQSALRGLDPLENKSVIQTLKSFDALQNVNYGFLCSLTNTNFNLFEINDFFRDKIISHDLKCNSLSFSLGRTYQEEIKFEPSESLGCNVITTDLTNKQLPKSESKTHVIHGENLNTFREILVEYLEQHYLQFIDSYVDGIPTIYNKTAQETPLLLCDIYESSLPYSVTEYMGKTLRGDPILEKTNCGADMADIISIDIDGNIRTCPHSGKEHIHGHLKNIKTIEIKSLDLDRGTHCESCVNNKLCRSSCPLDLPDETFMTNCRVEKVWYGELQKAAFRFLLNDQVKMLSTSLNTINK
jgi:radical SAM protein with 4Fe4S-binding SPASM domain